MISIAIIGQGNVGQHLYKAFSKAKKIDVRLINSRKLINIPDVDVYIIAVSDDAINKVSSKIKTKNNLVVHTSGSVSIDSLENEGRKGIFYLLQSFSKDKEVDFNEIPFCLETENKKDFALLETLAKSIGKKVYQINSDQRKKLHAAAVFANNFTNYMYTISSDICKENKIPFEILQPLIQETALKIKELSPREAQTGPAKRNDKKTIEKHLGLLNTDQQEIYKIITKSIQNNGKEL